MKGRMWPVASVLIGLGSLLCGCANTDTGTETGNPKPPALELRFSAFSDDFQGVSVVKPGGRLSVERALVSIEQLELLPCASTGKGVALQVGEIELTERPARLLMAESAETDFCTARVRLGPGTGDGMAELAGRSAVVAGVRADGVPFRIESELELAIDLQGEPPQTPFGTRRLLLGFNMATWLSGVGVEAAAADNGSVAIDATHLPDALAAFDARTGQVVALYDDADGNGQLAFDNQPPAAGP